MQCQIPSSVDGFNNNNLKKKCTYWKNYKYLEFWIHFLTFTKIKQ